MPIRLRVTLMFAAVMAGVLGLTGVVVYDRFADGLDRAIGENLEARAQEVELLADDGLIPGDIQPTAEVPLVTVIDGPFFAGQGEVAVLEDLVAAGLVPEGAAPSAEELVDLVPDEFTTFEATPGGLPSSVTLVGIGENPQELVALGVPLGERNASLAELRRLLWIALPLALLLSSLAAWWVASAALRPVELMRRRASEIPVTVGGRRLPLNGGRDEIQGLGTTINEMLARIEGGVERERALIADTSHEIRTPLAALDAQLQLAQRPGRPPDQVATAIERASAESQRLTALAEGLLLLAGADAGGLTVSPEKTPTEAWMQSVVERCTSGAGGGVGVEIDTTGAHEIWVDPELGALALGNLVDNALRHAQRKVRLTADAVGDAFAIVVSDDGAGFSADYLPTAFERFSRENGRSGGAAGLGLAITRSLVDAHGGTITAGNGTDGGARVEMVLPQPGAEA